MFPVDDCPKNLEELEKARERLACGTDVYGNNQYMCLPNKEKTSLVEFCYNGYMGIVSKGNCLEVECGQTIEKSCLSFPTGCPKNHTLKYNFYEHPACLDINTDRRCYTLDPLCSPERSSSTNCTCNDTPVVILAILLFFSFIIIGVCLWKILQRKDEEQQRVRNTIKLSRKTLHGSYRTLDYSDEIQDDNCFKDGYDGKGAIPVTTVKTVQNNLTQKDTNELTTKRSIRKAVSTGPSLTFTKEIEEEISTTSLTEYNLPSALIATQEATTTSPPNVRTPSTQGSTQQISTTTTTVPRKISTTASTEASLPRILRSSHETPTSASTHVSIPSTHESTQETSSTQPPLN